jgi:SAM-dependent methyltransferase
MGIVLLLIVVVVLLFGFVVLIGGAPYLPTLKPQIATALDLLDLQPGETMLELGSGDGRVLRAAAERGWKAVGYELNPLLVLASKWHTRKYDNVTIIWGNVWSKTWPEAQGVYVFGLDKIMKSLDKKFIQYPHKPLKVVSFTFQIPGKRPLKSQRGVFLYQYK